jgi:hypothetical protein
LDEKPAPETLPADADIGDVDAWPLVGRSLLMNRTASMPSANALPANASGCRRANCSTSSTS